MRGIACTALSRATGLALLALLAGCAHPPATAYDGGAVQASATAALGQNTAGEACSQSEVEPGRQYAIYCGVWKQPSATLRRGDAAEPALLPQLASTGPWREQLDATMSCAAPRPSTVLDAPAMLMSCSRRQEGFAQTAFVTVLDGRAWYADGVPAANLVMERALALDSGRIGAGSLGSVTESPGLAAQRLAGRVESASDIAAYQSLARSAVRANLAGEYAAAEDAYRRMVTVQRRTLDPDNPALAHALALQGLQASNLAHYQEADALLAKAQALAARSGGEDLSLAEVWHYQGLNLLNQDRPQEALILLHRAELAYLPFAPDTAHAREAGSALVPTDQSTRAAAFGVAETRRAQAVADRMLGRNAQSSAEAAGAEGVLMAYGLSNLKASARITRTEATVLLASGQSSQSLTKMRQAVLRFGRALPGSPAFARTQLLLAARLAEDGQTEQALRTCHAAGLALAQANTGADSASLQPCLALLAVRAESGDQAVAREMYALAGRVQGSTTSQQIALVSARLAENARDPRVAKLIRDRDDANALVAQLEAQRDEAADAGAAGGRDPLVARQIEDARRRRDSLEQALQSGDPNYGQLVQQSVSADDILHALRPREVFATVVLAPKAGYTFLFADGQIAVSPIDGGSGRVDALVARIRHAMDETGGGIKPFDTAASAELYTALFGHAGAVLAQANSLTVAPTGTLLSIPFGLLLTGPADPNRLTEAPFLIRRLVVAHVPAAASFVQLRRVAGTSRAQKPWFGFGDFRPVTPAQAAASFPAATCKDSAALFANLQLLPGATAELALARRLLGGSAEDALLGQAFTSRAVQDAHLSDYQVLHFATHAILQTDLACQAEPALVTSAPRNAPDAQGALLTASEVAGMKLDANVVLLSACNSGGPGGSAPGESLSGLARSFFYAGARSLLVTHWDVNDRVTSILVAATLSYARQHPSSGMAAALADAQRRLLDKARTDLPELAHPYYWAPLALIGEGRAISPLARAAS